MPDRETDLIANLDFFKSAILEPALRDQSIFNPWLPVHSPEKGRVYLPMGSPTSDFGAVEAAHWAWLGTRIRYFDGKAARELISSSKGVFKAWFNLQARKIISPEDEWASVIRPGEYGQPDLNEELFSAPVEF